MSSQAILVSGRFSQPRAVQVVVDEKSLILIGANGFAEHVAWWRLIRTGSGGSTHRFRRIDRREWELRVVAGADQALLSHVKSGLLGKFARPFHRLQTLKIVVSVVALAMMFSESIPARWLSSKFSTAAQERLVVGYIGSNARIRCNHPGGEQAVRAILNRLDPELGPGVEIVGLNTGGFMVTALPANKIMIFRDALTAVEADAVAALLAHELSHLRHDEATEAMVRHEGNVGALLAVFQGEDREDAYLKFSGQEEERADRDAMVMMTRAGISLKPAADMFEEMRLADYRNDGFAAEQRNFHFGIKGRAREWRQATLRQRPNLVPVLSGDMADDLYNFCWVGRVPSKALAPPPARPGKSI